MDDLLITWSNETEVTKFKINMEKEFKMSDLGDLDYFLGMEFVNTKHWIFLHQKKYAEYILNKFKMRNCIDVINHIKTWIKLKNESNDERVYETLYKNIIGSLSYICNTIPDICYMVRKFMEEPRSYHLLIAKRIPIYTKGTIDHGVLRPN